MALVVDLFGIDAFDVAKEFGVLSFFCFPTTAMVLPLTFDLRKLDEKFSCEYRDLLEPVKLPGCVSIHGSDFPDHFQDRRNEAYKSFVFSSKRLHVADGIKVDSFMDLEPSAFEDLKKGGKGKPPVYFVGLLIRSVSDGGVDESECLRWLDKQPNGLVLYVSFGSGGTLSNQQLNELALGLEMSRQRFLWVVQSPHETAANASYFSVQSIRDPLIFFPMDSWRRPKRWV